jgi:hypothetical protein
MTENHMLTAFLATLVCLWYGRSVEAIGIGGVMTGLIGVLGTFRPQNRNVRVDNAPGDPVPTEEAK